MLLTPFAFLSLFAREGPPFSFMETDERIYTA